MMKSAYRVNEMITETAVHEEDYNGDGMGAILDGDIVHIYSPYGVEYIARNDPMAVIEAMETAEISMHLIVEMTSKLRTPEEEAMVQRIRAANARMDADIAAAEKATGGKAGRIRAALGVC